MASPSAGEVAGGTVIAETYEVTQLIGKGGMGAVWGARHLRLPGKRVAIKMLHGGEAIDKESYARFRREAEIASRLGHPNIVEVLDFNTLPSGTPYLVLEFLDGESLGTRLKRGPLPLEEALEIIRQVGAALHAAHREDIVHRDLKPDNIFLCPTDSGGVLGHRVKVLDFGISKIRGSSTVQTQESALLGTPQYMSPEQAFGRNKSIDQRTDVFALGAIVYEMLTGEPAFNGETLAQVILAIVNSPAPSLAGRAPERVVAAVARAMAKEPADRFPDVASFVGELTGKPLQTLDRRPRVSGVEDTMAAGTASPLSGTAPRGEITSPPPTRSQSSPQKRAGVAALVLGGLGLAAAVGFGVARRAQSTTTPPNPPNAPNTINNPTNVPANNGTNNPPNKPVSNPVNPPSSPVNVVNSPNPPSNPNPTNLPNPPNTNTNPNPPNTNTNPNPPIANTSVANTPKHDPKKPAAEAIPAAVAADLESAEGELRAGKFDAAIHIARRTLNTQKTARAFALITRAYCAAGDLGNAKANLPQVGGERARVLRDCKKSGTDLQ